ncbi:MAG: hypothetical protein ACXVKA_02980 [Acidimicrobiia bacterium]
MITIELQVTDDGSSFARLDARSGTELIASFVEQPTPTGSRVTMTARAAARDEAGARELLETLGTHARARGGATLELETTDPLLRDEARWLGFTGSLRGPLVRELELTHRAMRQADTSAATSPEVIRSAISSLLPELPIVAAAGGGPLRALMRRAASGIPSTVNLSVAPAAGEAPTLFSVPNRSDLLDESIARCIDTIIQIRRRFGRVASAIRRVSFDLASFQLLHGQHAGSADRSVGVVHFNANFASVGGMLALDRQREQRAPGVSAGVPAPFNQIDGTAAHEAWHQMEGALEARRSLDGIALRRSLGEQLGVETLEHAVLGGRPRSPDAWKRAHVRLVTEVSPYAATAPVEATAEMFKLWWCSTGDPAPIVRQFGELIEGLLSDFKD